MKKDLTTGSVPKSMIAFSIPLLLSAVFQQLYNIADTVIAGKLIKSDIVANAGENAVAAISASYPITMIFMAVALGCNIGCSVIISQFYGKKDYAKLKTSVWTSIISFSVLSLILTVAGAFLSNPLLHAVSTPTNIFSDSQSYLNIYIYGLFFLVIYNICTGIFTAMGDSKTPLVFLICSSVGNIGLDILFVTVIPLGVAGVAWATFIAQGIAGISALAVLLTRMKKLNSTEKTAYFSANILYKIAMTSIPSILQQSFISVGNLLVQNLVNAPDDSAIVAGYGAAVKLNIFVLTCLNTFATAMSAFTAQNIGAGKIQRIKSGWICTMCMGFAIVAVSSGTILIFPEFFIRLFIDNPTPMAIKTGIDFIYTVISFHAVVAVKIGTDAVFRGSASMGLFMIATFADLILRVAISYALFPYMSVNAIWLSWPIGWIIGTILSLIFYFTGMWKKNLQKIIE